MFISNVESSGEYYAVFIPETNYRKISILPLGLVPTWFNTFYLGFNILSIYDERKYMDQFKKSKDDHENFETRRKIDTLYFASLKIIQILY